MPKSLFAQIQKNPSSNLQHASIKRGNATLFLSGAFFSHPHHRRVSLSQLPGAGRATPAPILLIRTRMRLIRWNKATAPSIETLRGALVGEGFSISEWSDPSGTIYPVHTHAYPEARAVVRGYLRVGLPESGEELVLGPGDRLDLPANTPHWADVNTSEPVVYLSAAKNGRTGHKMQ